MRGNVNPNTLRDVSRIQGQNGHHRLYSMAVSSRNTAFQVVSVANLDTENTPDSVIMNLLDMQIGKITVLNFMANHIWKPFHLFEDGESPKSKNILVNKNEIPHMNIINMSMDKYDRYTLDEMISTRCYHDHLCDHCMNTLKGYLQSGRIKLHYLADITPNDFH